MTRKHIFSLLTVIAVNLSGHAFGQGSYQSLPDNNIMYSIPVADPAPATLRLNEVHIKAVRSFTREYKEAVNVKWFPTPDGFAVYFRQKDVQARIYYNKKGNYACSVRYYDEAVLPKEVRHQVRSRYYDHQIYNVVEISAAGSIAYFIKLEGKTSWLDLKVLNWDIDILNEYSKL